jgi:hypothetical protein
MKIASSGQLVSLCIDGMVMRGLASVLIMLNWLAFARLACGLFCFFESRCLDYMDLWLTTGADLSFSNSFSSKMSTPFRRTHILE